MAYTIFTAYLFLTGAIALFMISPPLGALFALWLWWIWTLSKGHSGPVGRPQREGYCCTSCGKTIPAASACTFCEAGQPLD